MQPSSGNDERGRGGLFSPPRRGGPMSLGFIARGERIPRGKKGKGDRFVFLRAGFLL